MNYDSLQILVKKAWTEKRDATQYYPAKPKATIEIPVKNHRNVLKNGAGGFLNQLFDTQQLYKKPVYPIQRNRLFF